jgi:hypothetical protein
MLGASHGRVDQVFVPVALTELVHGQRGLAPGLLMAHSDKPMVSPRQVQGSGTNAGGALARAGGRSPHGSVMEKRNDM